MYAGNWLWDRLYDIWLILIYFTELGIKNNINYMDLATSCYPIGQQVVTK